MSPLIEPVQLAAVINDSRTVILDASWHMPASARAADEEFVAAHIPGARRFDFDRRIKDDSSLLPHMMPSAEVFQSAARALGINADSRVVVYDSVGLFAAPRAWWMFRVMGHAEVQVLHGGLPAWCADGFELESGAEVASSRPGNFTARLDVSRIRNVEQVRHALTNNSATIVDARSSARFQGLVAEPREGLRSGHMPGARNLPFELLIENGRFRDAGEMRQCWSDAGVGESDVLITTCGSGVSAAVLALSAEILGLPHASVYDGSWSEWGQLARSDLPVVSGPA